MKKEINPPVFYTSAGLIIFFVLLGIFFTEWFEKTVIVLNDTITTYFGWYLTLTVSLFVIFSLFLMFGRYKNTRLGPDYSTPEYSFFSWMAMLFSCGMGIGLLFYGVAEPMLHYATPPIGEPGTVEAAKTAMHFSFLHWGIHAWATYIIVGLSLAYFSFRKGFPLSLRYVFYPIFGERIHGRIGHLIEICAVFGTLFGVATSLGIGSMQINSGLSYLFGIPDNITVKIILITIITAMAMTSVISGINKGIKWLSVFNISVGTLLLLFVIAFGPTLFIIKTFIQYLGSFMQNVIEISFWNDAFSDSGWQNAWTLFYWSWWIAWSPYVGMFIARISKGRTISEFIFGVLFIPTLISMLFLTAFGGTGIFLHRQGATSIMTAVEENVSTALFEFFKHFPMTSLISGIGVISVITFFVTSSDSGSLVIDIITSGGNTNPPLATRIFWSILEGIVAATLLLGGGLIALQTAALSMALPFSFFLLLMCYCLYKSLKEEGT
ncbi:MAG: BCCT family transporter [Candidatus Woesearchaeota archaeon]